MITRRPLIVLVLSLLTGFAHAYEIQTHEKLSEVSFDASHLSNDPRLLGDFGLKATDTFVNSQDPNPRTIKELISDGSRFEDNSIRPLFHFFDALNDEGLLFFTSPTWSLEDKGKIHLLQNYSFRDARDHLYRALTLPDEGERKEFFGRTFESLGRVIHHIQDMAQPQHVRLDSHLNLNLTDEELPFENRSRYEHYTKDNADKLTPLFGLYPPVNSAIDSNFLTTARSFWHTESKNPLAGQGIAEFTNTNFLSAGTNFDTIRYTYPRFEDATPWDDNANQLLQSAGVTPPPECLPPNRHCLMTFFRAPVTDNYRPAASGINDRASTLSIFDQDLKAFNRSYSFTDPDTGEVHTTHDVFSLNRFNFDEAHKFLIPRAVAYSAGLIDYFFRGRLEADSAEFTDTGIRLRIKNAIDPQATPAWAEEGLHAANATGEVSRLVIAFEYEDSTGTKQHGVSDFVTLQGPEDARIAPGKTSVNAYDFTFTLPSDASNVKYRLVFRGKLGEEDDAVAVGAVDPISGFLVTPSYLPADGIAGPRLIEKRGGRWVLSDKTGLVAGNIDWKGWYVNGKPTRVLTWSGPSTRHFPDHPGKPFHQVFRSEIFQNGEVHADAPLPVLGAALTKAADGSEWIVAICSDGIEDIVYRRPNKKTDSSELFDPVMNPEGWQEIDRFPPEPEFKFADRPWFFNGSGTKALTLRRLTIDPTRETAGGDKTTLLEIEILDASSAIRTNRGNLGGHHQKTESVVTVVRNQSGFILSATLHSTSSGQGRHVVAVDYLNAQERICTHERLLNGAVANASSFSPVLSVTNDRTFDDVERIDCETFTINIVEAHDTVSLRRAPDSTFTTSRDADIQLVVEFIDLRYDLIAFARSENRVAADLTSDPAAAIQCGGFGGFLRGSGARRSSSQELEQIDFGGQLLGVFDAEEISESSLNCFSIVPFTATKSGVTTSEVTLYPSIVGGSRAVGGWALDSKGNFIASQIEGAFHFNQVTGGFGTGKHFNHLTGGDLSSIISGAPGDARYYPVAVIH